MRFQFHMPWYEATLNLLLIGFIGVAVVKLSIQELSALDLMFKLLPLLPIFFHAWRAVPNYGGTLHVNERGLSLQHERLRFREWHLPKESIKAIRVIGDWPGKALHITPHQGPLRVLRLVNWSAPNRGDSKDWNRHPLVLALRRHFEVGEMSVEERMATMELGETAKRLTIAMAAFSLLGFVLLFLPGSYILGEGIPWWPIMASGAVAAMASTVVLIRNRAPRLNYPIVPLLAGASFAFLFTAAAHNALFFTGKDVSVEYRLAVLDDGEFQRWQDVAVQAPNISIVTREARYTREGTTVFLQLRKTAFGFYFCSRKHLKAKLGR